jgi:hypothetical protein
LAVARARQTNKEGRATRIRDRAATRVRAKKTEET